MKNLRSVFFVLALGAAVCLPALAQQPAPQSAPAPGGQPGQLGPHKQFQGHGIVPQPNNGNRQFGEVTESAADHFTIKADSGDLVKIQFSSETGIFGTPPPPGSVPGGPGAPPPTQNGQRGPGSRFMLPNLQPTDIKIGDTLIAFGDFDADSHTLAATRIMRIDPERARMMHDTRENYGKIWLEGNVASIDGQKITVTSPFDSSPIPFVVDRNTTYHKRNLTITLAEIHVGDKVRAEGGMNGGIFHANTVQLRSYPVTDLIPKGITPPTGESPKPTAPQQ